MTKSSMKSAKKRHWICLYNEFEENKPHISWSSSDSDTEDTSKLIKGKRIQRQSLEAQKNKVDESPLRESHHERDIFLQSPIISGSRLEDRSSILSQPDFSLFKEESPVLNRSKFIRKFKCQTKHKKSKSKTETSLDDSFHIETFPTQIHKSEFPEPYKIEPFPSQDSTEVVADTSASTTSDSNFLYHHPPPRRKRFKKGGLADQLQKALNLQNNGVGIWHHEIFLNGVEVQTDKNNEGIELTFIVVKKWKEYGCIVLECINTNSKNLVETFNLTELANLNSFILIVGLNSSSICFEVDNRYKIFPPYVTKLVEYQEKQTLCLINGSRFLSL